MAIETLTPTTRRNVLAVAIGTLAAFAAEALGRPLPARATDGDVIHVGDDLTAASETKITNSTNSGAVLWGITDSGWGVRGSADSGNGVGGDSGSGYGVYGYSNASGIGVLGYSNSNIGIRGENVATGWPAIRGQAFGDNTGVLGVSGDTAVAAPAKTGVYGHANQDANAHGVWGASGVGLGVRGNSNEGFGVWGAASSGVGVRGDSGSGVGVYAHSSSSIGVDAATLSATQPAIRASGNANGAGVFGFSGAGTPPAAPAKTGVYGYAAQDANARGVTGRSTVGRGVNGIATTGYGVVGSATSGRGIYGTATTGIAGQFASSSGTALQVNGKAKFSTSGKLAVAAGSSSASKTLAGVTTGSLILAVFQSNEPGVWVRGAVPAAGSFRVYFNVALPTNATLGYFVIN